MVIGQSQSTSIKDDGLEDMSLFCSLFAGRDRGRFARQGINDLPRTGIPQVFTSFFFNRLRITLQGFDLLFQVLILLLHRLDLLLQLAVLLALLLVHHEPIGAKDHMPGHKAGQQANPASRKLASRLVEPLNSVLEGFWQSRSLVKDPVFCSCGKLLQVCFRLRL